MRTLAHPATERLTRVAIAGVLFLLLAALLPLHWSWAWPKEWVLPLAAPITNGFKWLTREFTIGGVEFGVLVRALAKIVEAPLVLVQGLLAKGFNAFGLRLPPVPWFVLLVTSSLLAHWAGGWRLTALVAGTGAYLLLVGLWDSAMLTMASVLIAVALGVAIGVLLGVAAWRDPRVERMMTPLYDLLQVLPIFSYLVPIIVFFGFGPLAGLVATAIFATPPMARVTTLALGRLPRSAFDLATITGCRRWQGLWLVLLPSARTDLLVGVNQVVNLSFAVAVFAAIIGSGGLGNDLFAALKSLRLGPAMEAGLAITLLAIALDRTFRAIALRRSMHEDKHRPAMARHQSSAAAAIVLVAGYAATLMWPDLAAFPSNLVYSSGQVWNDAVSGFNAIAGDAVGRFRDVAILWVLRPVKDALHATPWIVFVGAAAIVAMLLDGPRLVLLVVALLFFIVVTGSWGPAMTSLYLVFLGSVLAVLIGFPLGVLGALSRRVGAFNGVLVDAIQTLPPFIYLVPLMMVLGIGDVPALASIVVYAAAPAIRYTQSGLLEVRPSVLEAATMGGCTRWQRLRFVQLPISVPYILLGLNQTVIMAFGMLVITALLGTRGLEATTLTALGKVDTGAGLVAGFALVALTIVADRLISAAARRVARPRGEHVGVA